MWNRLMIWLSTFFLFLSPGALTALAENASDAAVKGDMAVISSPKNYRTPPPSLQTETNTPASVTPTPDGQTKTTANENQKGGEEKSGGESEKYFTPHWMGQLGLSYSSQPSQLGQGQITRDLTLTGTYVITESGHSISLGITGGQQKVEGADTNYGGFTVEGGLGLGFFLPSLSIATQVGSASLNSIDSTLTLNFQFFESLTVGLILAGGTESHQGPNPISRNTGTLVEIDSVNWAGGLVLDFVPWDFLSLSLTGQQTTDTTYQWQTVSQTIKNNLNSSDRSPSLALGSNITFWKDFVLELSGQVGQEFYPAGTVYSTVLKKTVTFATPTTENFSGFTMGLMYNFQ